ncbi:MAG: hypothetical protein FD169_2528 [Bacillota bacterium]|nr:MAG: hypothetical protein FD169_2528 [Bacillota bacterium]
MRLRRFYLFIGVLLVVLAFLAWGLWSQPYVSIVGTPHDRRLFNVKSRIEQPAVLEYWIEYYYNGEPMGSVLTSSTQLLPRQNGLPSRHQLAIIWSMPQENLFSWTFTFDGQPTQATGELLLPKADQGSGLFPGQSIVIKSGDSHTLAVYGYGPVRAELSGNSLEAILDHMTHVCVLRVRLDWDR